MIFFKWVFQTIKSFHYLTKYIDSHYNSKQSQIFLKVGFSDNKRFKKNFHSLFDKIHVTTLIHHCK